MVERLTIEADGKYSAMLFPETKYAFFAKVSGRNAPQKTSTRPTSLQKDLGLFCFRKRYSVTAILTMEGKNNSFPSGEVFVPHFVPRRFTQQKKGPRKNPQSLVFSGRGGVIRTLDLLLPSKFQYNLSCYSLSPPDTD